MKLTMYDFKKCCVVVREKDVCVIYRSTDEIGGDFAGAAAAVAVAVVEVVVVAAAPAVVAVIAAVAVAEAIGG